MIVSIIGWTALIASWILPYLMNNKQKARLIGLALSAFACGLFLGAIITKYLAL